jgi:hypothetical protein
MNNYTNKEIKVKNIFVKLIAVYIVVYIVVNILIILFKRGVLKVT